MSATAYASNASAGSSRPSPSLSPSKSASFKKHQQRYRSSSSSIDASDLLNFRPAGGPPSSWSRSSSRGGRSGGNGRGGRTGSINNKPQNQKRQKQKQKQEEQAVAERRARRELSSAFYLHTSPNHSFILSPSVLGISGGVGGSGKHVKFGEVNTNVKWDGVKMIRWRVETNPNETESSVRCPICLDDFVSPRIGRCGHVFCLPCIMRHLYTSTTSASSSSSSTSTFSPQKNERKTSISSQCPCCTETLNLNDLKPVALTSVQPPQIGRSMKFQRLFRRRRGYSAFPFMSGSSYMRYQRKQGEEVESPGLPFASHPQSIFCRFSCLDDFYLRHLHMDKVALEGAASEAKAVAAAAAAASTVAVTTIVARGAAKVKPPTWVETATGTRTGVGASSKSTSRPMGVTGAAARTLLGAGGEGRPGTVAGSVARSGVADSSAAGGGGGDTETVSEFMRISLETVEQERVAILKSEGFGRSGDAGKDVVRLEATHFEEKDNNSSVSVLREDEQSSSFIDSSSAVHPRELPSSEDFLQFYQASDGQLCFLCGFNVLILNEEYRHTSFHAKVDGTCRDESNGNNFALENVNDKDHDKGMLTRGHDGDSRDGNVTFANTDQAADDDEEEKSKQLPRSSTATSLPALPETVMGQVIDVETVRVTQENRKRFAFLSHIPLFTDVKIVEVNFDQRYVSEETRNKFKSDIEKRKKRRRQRIQNEKRADRALTQKKDREIEKQEEEMRRKGIFRRQDVDWTDEFWTTATTPASPLSEEFGPGLGKGGTTGKDAEDTHEADDNGKKIMATKSFNSVSAGRSASVTGLGLNFKAVFEPKNIWPELGDAAVTNTGCSRKGANSTQRSKNQGNKKSTPTTSAPTVLCSLSQSPSSRTVPSVRIQSKGGVYAAPAHRSPSLSSYPSPPSVQNIAPVGKVCARTVSSDGLKGKSKGGRSGKQKIVLFSTGGQRGSVK